MKRNFQFLFLAGAFLALWFLSVPAPIWAQGLPEGIKVDLVAEYPGKTAGVEKIQLMKFTFQPGAVVKNMKEAHTAL